MDYVRESVEIHSERYRSCPSFKMGEIEPVNNAYSSGYATWSFGGSNVEPATNYSMKVLGQLLKRRPEQITHSCSYSYNCPTRIVTAELRRSFTCDALNTTMDHYSNIENFPIPNPSNNHLQQDPSVSVSIISSVASTFFSSEELPSFISSNEYLATSMESSIYHTTSNSIYHTTSNSVLLSHSTSTYQAVSRTSSSSWEEVIRSATSSTFRTSATFRTLSSFGWPESELYPFQGTMLLRSAACINLQEEEMGSGTDILSAMFTFSRPLTFCDSPIARKGGDQEMEEVGLPVKVTENLLVDNLSELSQNSGLKSNRVNEGIDLY